MLLEGGRNRVGPESKRHSLKAVPSYEIRIGAGQGLGTKVGAGAEVGAGAPAVGGGL